jgi:hypothetical protein
MRAHALFGAVALAVGSTLSMPAGATPIYDETINTGSVAYAVTPATVSDFINCFTSFGCMGKAGQVWSDPVNLTPSAVNTIPTTISYIFTLTPQQQPSCSPLRRVLSGSSSSRRGETSASAKVRTRTPISFPHRSRA